MTRENEEYAHPELVDGSVTAKHSHPGGGADIKSGLAVGQSGSVSFDVSFSSTPQVVMTPQDSEVSLRDCLWKVNSVSVSGFTWEADTSMTLAWIATNAGGQTPP